MPFTTFWGVGAHEFFHAQIARMLGYEAYVHFPSWTSGWVSVTPWPSKVSHIVLIGLGGGGIVALFYYLISLFTSDWETDLVMYFFVPLQGYYAIFEVFYLLGAIPLFILGTIPALLAGVTLLYFYLLGEIS